MHKETEIQQSLREAYWRKKISEASAVSEYRSDLAKQTSDESATNRRLLSASLCEEELKYIRELSKGNSIAEYSVFLSLYAFLISKYFNVERCLIGGPALSKAPNGIESESYQFFNIEPANALDSRELITHTGKEVTKSMAYGSTGRPDSEELAFQFTFSLIPFTKRLDKNVESGLELCLTRNENSGISVELSYTPDAFYYINLDNFCQHYISLVKALKSNKDRPLTQVSMLSETDKIVLSELAGSADYSFQGSTIVQLFEQQAESTPNATALVFDGRIFTYRELNERSNSLAYFLRNEKGIERNDAVVLMAGKSELMIIGILAILKAGGAYLPIDVGHPTERIELIVGEAQPKLILTEFEFMQGLIPLQTPMFLLDIQLSQLPTNTDNLPAVNKENDLSCVFYTSGSTGTPNGVLVEHKSVVRLVKDTNYIDVLPSDKFIQTGSISFDASTFELWATFLNGASLNLSKDRELLDTALFKERVIAEDITTIWITTGWFHSVIDTDIDVFSTAKNLVFGGQRVSIDHFNRLREKFPDLNILHCYGPTENTTFSTVYRADKTTVKELPIGRPITGTTLYILDKGLLLSAPGVKGEIYLGGAGLSRGYLNRPELDKKKFVESPEMPGVRLYRTGDIGRWDENGMLEFHGRRDRQLKVRGFRIEPGEIENKLVLHPSIENCEVLGIKDDRMEMVLIAFYVQRSTVTEAELKNYLESTIPAYMIPDVFVPIDALPLNANGKTDSHALVRYYENEFSKPNYNPPRDALEQSLARIWEEILGIENIGIEDNFFLLGGHSLKVGRLLSMLQKTTGHEVPLNLIFEYPTIKQIAEFIRDMQTGGQEKVESISFSFNSGQKETLFVFPAGNGFGLGYSGLASHLLNYNIVAYNFHDGDGHLGHYIKDIISSQASGPYTLVGYSAGGNLAYEVAVEMEAQGLEVERLILIDSAVRESTKDVTKEEAQEWASGFLNYHEYQSQIQSEYLRDIVHGKVAAYYRYIKGSTEKSKLSTDIHLVLSKGHTYDYSRWSEFTSGDLIIHKGGGEHEQMLKGDSLLVNARIIEKEILEGHTKLVLKSNKS